MKFWDLVAKATEEEEEKTAEKMREGAKVESTCLDAGKISSALAKIAGLTSPPTQLPPSRPPPSPTPPSPSRRWPQRRRRWRQWQRDPLGCEERNREAGDEEAGKEGDANFAWSQQKIPLAAAGSVTAADGDDS
jgi:hypothetical protein